MAEVEERKKISCGLYFSFFLESSENLNEQLAGEPLLARSSSAASASKQSYELLEKYKVVAKWLLSLFLFLSGIKWLIRRSVLNH